SPALPIRGSSITRGLPRPSRRLPLALKTYRCRERRVCLDEPEHIYGHGLAFCTTQSSSPYIDSLASSPADTQPVLCRLVRMGERSGRGLWALGLCTNKRSVEGLFVQAKDFLCKRRPLHRKAESCSSTPGRREPAYKHASPR